MSGWVRTSDQAPGRTPAACGPACGAAAAGRMRVASSTRARAETANVAASTQNSPASRITASSSPAAPGPAIRAIRPVRSISPLTAWISLGLTRSGTIAPRFGSNRAPPTPSRVAEAISPAVPNSAHAHGSAATRTSRTASTTASARSDANRSITWRPTVPSTMYGSDSATATRPIAPAPACSHAIHITAMAYRRSPNTDAVCAPHSRSTGPRRSNRTYRMIHSAPGSTKSRQRAATGNSPHPRAT